MKNAILSRIMAAATALAACVGYAGEVKQIDVPAGELTEALEVLAKQSGAELVYQTDQVKVFRTQGVNGNLSAEEALERLLKGTPLAVKTDPTGAILIAVPKVKELAGAQAGPAGSGAEIAQAGAPSASQGEGEGDNQKGSSGSSASAEAERTQVQEIVVTAQKRTERLQDVPISISVVSGAELDRSTGEGVAEALSRVPGTAINVTAQGGATQVVMRGVSAGDALFSGSSPVSYYLDGVPFGFVRQAIAPDANAYDLERVEVLRGPQGTLYGASAQNGVVRVLTHDADPNRFEFKARTAASATEGGGGNYRGDMAFNVPIIDGKLAARAVLGYQDQSGWIERPNKKNVNDAEIKNLRLKVNAQATEQLSIGLSAWFSRADFGGPSTSNDDGKQVALFDEPIATDFDTYGLKLAYDFSSLSVTSTSSYLKYKNRNFRDLLYFAPDFREEDIFDSEVLVEEIVLNSNQNGPWRWSLGGMYRDAEDLQYQVYHSGGFVDPASDQIYISKSFAAFGEVSRRFLDGSVELTGGLRYFEDDVTSRDDLRLVDGSERFDAISPRVVLTWYPSEDLTAYASYAEGFRGGFPQSGYLLANAPGFPSLDPDTLHNYEVGAKGNLWNRRLEFDTALYYIDWKDVQQSLTVPVTTGTGLIASALINGESASGIGFEFGLTARPADGLELGLNFSWNDLNMDADVITFVTPTMPVVLFSKGDRLNLSPEYTAGARAEYSVPLGRNGFKTRLSVSANYTSEMDIRTIDISGARSIAPGEPMLLARASLALEAPGNWTVTVFVENLGNELDSPVRLPFAPGLVDDWDMRVRPRTIGAQLEYRFK